jgi:exodeoxyribonuclease X
MELIFLDTETTGNDVTKDRLCQVCFLTSAGTRTSYFKPPLPMSVKSMSVTHITNKMLEDKESFSDSVMKKDLENLLKDGVLVAHNAKFDCAMLEAEGLSVPRKICTLRVARYLDRNSIIPEYNLQFLRYYLDLEVEGNAHDAEGDVRVLHAVFDRLFSKLKETLSDDTKVIEKMIEISSIPSLFTKFNFGKYKDKSIDEIANNDRGYLEWLLAQKKSAPDEDEDWIYTLQYYLSR